MDIVYPEWLYNTTYIYHITHIHNLNNILRSGHLYATNYKSCDHTSIANEEVQKERSKKQVVIEPKGCLHDYIPFYFAPRSPMLYVNYVGSIDNARSQEDIIYLVTHAEKINNSDIPFVFYDRHALVEYARAFNDVRHLNEIKWNIFFEPPPGKGNYAQYWQDKHVESKPEWTCRKEIRQAEFLVHKKLPWELIQRIATMTEEKKEEVQDILGKFDINTLVETKPEWYYL